MGELSKIEWTDHTFNPWWGCAKVSPGCDNCYAEALAARFKMDVWGRSRPRRMMSEKHWAEPLKWDRDARDASVSRRVFCASMADVFEAGRPELEEPRERLWALIRATPNLDWLLLTKRPHNVQRMVPWPNWLWPENVWLGTTVERNELAKKRLGHLRNCGAKVRFVSCEPLLGFVNLDPWLQAGIIHWVIVGGESGAGARPMDGDWARHLRNQCRDHSVKFFFKQWGEWRNGTRMGKGNAGRDLDGRKWDEIPIASI